ncbi:MAG: hypothetical protein HFJ46_08160, partial [Clostridia bacterium]|nr:hypothetical protein [Clostridia bacterium]
FDHYAIEILQEKNSVLQEVEVSSATEETKNLKVLVKDNIETLIDKKATTETRSPEISIDKLKAPISAGSTVGTITYTIDGKSYSSDLIAGDDVLPSNTLSFVLHICLIVVTLYLLFTLLKSKNNTKPRGRSSKSSKSYKHKKSKKASGKHLYTLMNNYE